MSARALYSSELEAPGDWAARCDATALSAVAIGAARSREVRERLQRAGVVAAEVRSAADLAAIPVLPKDHVPDLQASAPPFGGMLAVPVGELRRIYQSPGPILDPEGDRPDFWRMAPALWAAGFREGHVTLNTFSYHLTPGAHMLDAGLRALGCVVVPGGVGNSAAQVALARQAGVVAYVGTPQFLLTLLEIGAEASPPFRFERALVTGAPLPPALRSELQGSFGVDVYQAYGTADAGLLGYECSRKDGWHVEPRVVIEIVEPASGAPVQPGESGEVVVTSPNEVYPLVRFGTGDLSAFVSEPCDCGRTTPRLVGFLGRVGEGVKVRGMFVHPRQLGAVLSAAEGVARYQAVVSSDGHRDVLKVSVEPSAGAVLDRDALSAGLAVAIKVRADVEIVPSGTLAGDAAPLVDERDL